MKDKKDSMKEKTKNRDYSLFKWAQCRLYELLLGEFSTTKTAALVCVFSIMGGGGSIALQKFWNTFCSQTVMEFWQNSKVFGHFFFQLFGELEPKKCLKSYLKKKKLKGKSCQTSRGGPTWFGRIPNHNCLFFRTSHCEEQ